MLFQEMKSESCAIVQMIKDGNLKETDIFDGPIVTTPNEERPDKLKGRRGLYVFTITQDISFDSEKVRAWNGLKQAGLKSSLKQEFHKDDCLYLGSVWGDSGSIFCRLKEHYSDKKDAKGLALNHPSRRKIRDAVQVYAFPIKKLYTREEYRIILPNIENMLHESLKPVAGMKR